VKFSLWVEKPDPEIATGSFSEKALKRIYDADAMSFMLRLDHVSTRVDTKNIDFYVFPRSNPGYLTTFFV